MNVIGRLTPSIESQVDLKKFRGVSTADALYRMSGVRITGFLGSMTAIYGFAIDIFEDIQNEINIINKKLEKTHKRALKLEKKQIEIENEELKKKAEILKKQKEKEKKSKEEKDKNLLVLQKLNQTHEYNIFEYDENILSNDENLINIIEEYERNNESQFCEKYKKTQNAYSNYMIMKNTTKDTKDIKYTNKIKGTNEQKGKKVTEKYEYEFPYEYQYSFFEDECLKSILEQRAEKFDFFKEQQQQKQQQKQQQQKQQQFIEDLD